ncbi:MAG: acetyltransferase [Roseiflexaceae bacterium]
MTNTSQPPLSLERQLAERVHAACVQTLIAAYDQAASDGLCAEGAWEVALDRLRSLDLDRLLHDHIR